LKRGHNAGFGFQLEFFLMQLNLKTVQLMNNSSIVCVFVSCVDAKSYAELAAKRVEIIAFALCGF
jgi:D-lactate dehydrogenase